MNYRYTLIITSIILSLENKIIWKTISCNLKYKAMKDNTSQLTKCLHVNSKWSFRQIIYFSTGCGIWIKLLEKSKNEIICNIVKWIQLKWGPFKTLRLSININFLYDTSIETKLLWFLYMRIVYELPNATLNNGINRLTLNNLYTFLSNS